MSQSFSIACGDVSAELPKLDPESFDAVLCDPPYGLGFMGKAWDHGVPGPEVWKLVYRALKPGAMLMAFGGTRTFHRLTCAIEDAGFEIRDCLSWLYGSGFPKSHNLCPVGENWQGYGTALKPAWEPIILAMKPLDGTFAENALEHGVAGLNVDGGRIGTSDTIEQSGEKVTMGRETIAEGYDRPGRTMYRTDKPKERSGPAAPLGRWPSNVLLDEEAAAMLDEQSGNLGRSSGTEVSGEAHPSGIYGSRIKEGRGQIGHGDSGGASRFFYTAKASRSEREAGLREAGLREAVVATGSTDADCERNGSPRFTKIARNHHPTVKPIDLARYLATLILPPKRDTPRRLLVPFSGSGSEMIGSLLAGWDEVVGIEREAEYVQIARARVAHSMHVPIEWVPAAERRIETFGQIELFEAA